MSMSDRTDEHAQAAALADRRRSHRACSCSSTSSPTPRPCRAPRRSTGRAARSGDAPLRGADRGARRSGCPILFHMVLGRADRHHRRRRTSGATATRATGSTCCSAASGLFLVCLHHLPHLEHALRAEALSARRACSPYMQRTPARTRRCSCSTCSARSRRCFHFGNGLFGFAIHWGLATGRDAQRAGRAARLAVALVLTLVGVNGLLGLRRPRRAICSRSAHADTDATVAQTEGRAEWPAPRIAVVGGGLAGLMADDQDRRGRRAGRPVLDRAGQALALGVRAGRHQRRGEHQGRGRLARDPLRRHGATAATSSPTSRPSRACATRRRASSTCSTAWACRSTARPRACSTSAASAARCYHRTAFAGATTGQQLLYALDEQVRRHEAAGPGHQVRALGVPRHRARRRRPLRRHRRARPAHA